MPLTQVCHPRVTLVSPLSSPFRAGLGSQVSETEREDLEESEKIQYWVERLCQTRLEQISSADNEISEVTEAFFPQRPLLPSERPPRRQREARWPGQASVSRGPLTSPLFLPLVRRGTCLCTCLSPVTTESQLV